PRDPANRFPPTPEPHVPQREFEALLEEDLEGALKTLVIDVAVRLPPLQPAGQRRRSVDWQLLYVPTSAQSQQGLDFLKQLITMRNQELLQRRLAEVGLWQPVVRGLAAPLEADEQATAPVS